MPRFTILLSLLIISSMSFSQKKIKNTFLFPLSIKPLVSSSFAELRTDHFHSGIDLSTSGKTGYPVSAMEEGVISRIKVSSVGYGNALYIKHNNGYTTVYAHMKSYSKKIEHIINKVQYQKKSFYIDYFPKDTIPIKKGEIIGFSGDTGSSGGPHLHYEIRNTKTEEPINPFLFQNLITDNVSPQIESIRIYPLNKDSRVNGINKAQNFAVVFYDGKFHLKGHPIIKTKGEIGVAIKMIDYLTGSWKRCGVYKLDLFKNNTHIYGWEMFKFSFDESRYINSHVDYAYHYNTGHRYEKCFRDPNNKLSIYKGVVNEGRFTCKSKNLMKIDAYDAAGNKSELNFYVLADKKVYPTIKTEIKANNYAVKYDTDFSIKKENFSCYIPKNSLYKNIIIPIQQLSNKSKEHQNIYQIGEPYIPLHTSINIKLKCNQKTKTNQLCAALISNKGHLYYGGGKYENNNIVLRTRNFGRYTITRDAVPPHITLIKALANSNYTTRGIMYFRISDSFSGIKSYEGIIDGKWCLFEYDAKTGTLCCHLSTTPIKKGSKHHLDLTVCDNCDNHTVKKYDFVY